MDLMSLLAGAGLGGLVGVLASQVANYLVSKGLVEQVVEEAEAVIPDQLEKPLGKLLDAAAKELMDTDKDEE